MKYDFLLMQSPGGGLRLKTAGGKARRVCTAGQACRRLKRTRRQVYRYIQDGLIESRGKVLGEWLLDEESVARLAMRPAAVQPLPARLQPLFPEYDARALNAGRDRVLVMARVLESGGREDLRWLTRRYAESEIARFIEEDGARLLGPRSLRLWSLCFGARPKPSPAWRKDLLWRAAQP